MRDSVLDKSGLVYVRVREELREQITALEEGVKLLPERDLSEKFKVDRATVRRALKDLQKEGYVVRYHGKGTFVGKLPVISNIANQSGIIGLVIPNIGIPFISEILSGVEAASSSESYSVLLCNSLEGSEREKRILDNLDELNVYGILIVPQTTDSFDPDYLRLITRLRDKGMRIVMVDQYLPELDVPSVTTDKVEAGYIVTEHLIMLGHKRICYACSASYDVSGRDCLRGYRMALADYGIEFDSELVIDVCAQLCAGPTHDAVTDKLTRNPRAFTAIATPCFSMTHGIMTALTELGKRVPDDIALVGGDVYPESGYSHVTHTLQSTVEMGREAFRLLMSYDNDRTRKRHILLKPRLVIGSTCGAKTRPVVRKPDLLQD